MDIDKNKPKSILWFDKNKHVQVHIPEDRVGPIQLNTFKYFLHPDMITRSGCVTLMTLFLLCTIEHGISNMLKDKNKNDGKYLPLLAVFATNIWVRHQSIWYDLVGRIRMIDNRRKSTTNFVILIFLLVSCVYMGLTKEDAFPQTSKTFLVIGMTLLVIYDNIKETQGSRLDCPHNLHYVNTQTSQKRV